MSPSAGKVQCPFCLGHPRTKDDGTMYLHDWGRPGMRKRCPGAARTREQAKEAKLAGRRDTVLPSGQVEKLPEEIF